MGKRSIKKVLVANRGEIALRVIRTCREMGIETVAVYSEIDRNMPHVLNADEAYHIGPPPSRESYLLIEKILEVAKRAKVDAVHPGYGFLAENDEFAERVSKEGLIFVGPSADSIRAMGDKTEARRLVSNAKVPVVPGTEDSVESAQEARSFCKEYGYPVLIKAVAGGGGKGMRIVHKPEDLPQLFSAAQSEARSAFGDSRVYVEKYLERPRHVEFQILADQYGNTVHLGERECTIQRRHQKVVEETPSIILDDAMRAKMGMTAVLAAKACNYQNAGTIEFLVDKDKNFYFLEMNTRLQVEHPITEMRTGIDLVAQQLRVAMGEELGFRQGDISFYGHAIECRIYAEDVENDFLPSTGIITHLKPSQGLGVREDRGVEQGGEISVYYDPMISKLVVWGGTRSEAIERMKRALREYEILGVRTNIPLNLFVLQHPKFVSGDFDTHFLANYYRPELLEKTTAVGRTAAAVVCALLHDRALSRGSLQQMSETMPNSRNEVHSMFPSQNHVLISKWKQQRINNMRS
ncbi:MAG: acetyl-CoA carboxylase biotin carboxylase subunit [Ignavibacteria bacterium]|nr:acetyl-CoA carboxylase biotin carboxylase subunit [Ignavibacteria bacterium]